MGTLQQPHVVMDRSSNPQDTTTKATGLSSSLEYSRPFTDLTNIQPSTLQAIQNSFGYDHMSKVQSEVLSGIPTTHDLLVKARTGTGKTLAFLVAALESLMALPDGGAAFKYGGKIGCVIVVPTRELALQITDEAQRLLKPLGWGVQYLVGGESKSRQLDGMLKEAAGFVVATPGRLQDMLINADIADKVAESKVLVLDEADTMLELGFRKELDSILKALPKDRQTFLFSATVDSKLEPLLKVALGRETMDQVVKIDTVGEKGINLNLATRQRYCFAPYQSHVALVRRIINDHFISQIDPESLVHLESSKKSKAAAPSPSPFMPEKPTKGQDDNSNKIMVFLPTTRGAQLYAKIFASLSMGKELSVYEIHSAKSQRERSLTSRNFKRIQTPAVLFTSDISARGVDYPGVGLVIQVGAPLSLNHYIHRIGRTGRGEGKGKRNGKSTKHRGNLEEEHGKGVLVLGELDQGFIEHQLKPSPLFSVIKQEHAYDDWQSVIMGESLDRKFKKALSNVDEKLAKSAYTAFLGYNLTVGPRIGNTDRKRILEAADNYISAFGVLERPAVSTSFLERMGFMKHYIPAIEGGEETVRQPHEYELVDGSFPTINTRITKSPFASPSTSNRDSESEKDLDGDAIQKEKQMTRKERQEAFEEEIGLGDTEFIKVNEEEWEDFMEFKPGLPKLIAKLHSPKRMGHIGNRPSKKISKIFSDNDGW